VPWIKIADAARAVGVTPSQVAHAVSIKRLSCRRDAWPRLVDEDEVRVWASRTWAPNVCNRGAPIWRALAALERVYSTAGALAAAVEEYERTGIVPARACRVADAFRLIAEREISAAAERRARDADRSYVSAIDPTSAASLHGR